MVLIRVALCRGLVVMVITLLAAAFLPRPFGFVGTTVLTGSMAPSIQPGDVALVFPLPADEYEAGQVILFPDPAEPDRQLLHRLVEITPDGEFVTKGDANRSADSTPVDPSTVIGVGRVLVPSIGLPIVWAATGLWLLTLGSLIVMLVMVRGTLAIEYFPRTSKGEVVRLVLESGTTALTIAFGVLIVALGVERGSYAAFMATTDTNASWAMAPATPTPTPTPPPTRPPGPTSCEIRNWTYHIQYPVTTAIVNFEVRNTASVEVTGSWHLEWDFSDDQRVTNFNADLAQEAQSYQDGTHVRYVGETWSVIRPNQSVQGQMTVESLSESFAPPENLTLDGTACTFVPTPTPTPTPTPSPAPAPAH